MNKDCSDARKVIVFEKVHKQKKDSLGHRVHILRVLIQRFYREKRDLFTPVDYIKHCEAVLDNTLSRFDYDLEGVIDSWRAITPALGQTPATCEKCGYRPVFCRCI